MKKTIIIKPTLACNLRCKYCYEFARPNRDFLESGFLTPEKCINIAKRFAKIFPKLELLWIFHGGEPLLIGEKNFEKILKEFSKIRNEQDVNFEISIQTNATLITDEWINLILKNKELFPRPRISISIDGPKDCTDFARIFNNNNNSVTDKIFENVQKLHTAGIGISVLCVVGKHNVKKSREVYNFINTLNPQHSNYNPCYNLDENGNLSNFGISPLEYAEFIKEIFQYWREDLKKGILRFIDPISTVIANLMKKEVNFCEYSKNKCDNFISIFPNGDFVTCEVYSGNQMEHVKLGNIFELTDEELLDKISNPNKHTDFLKFKKRIYEKCEFCELEKICNGGCLALRDRFLNTNEKLFSLYCEGKKSFINHIKKYIFQILQDAKENKN